MNDANDMDYGDGDSGDDELMQAMIFMETTGRGEGRTDGGNDEGGEVSSSSQDAHHHMGDNNDNIDQTMATMAQNYSSSTMERAGEPGDSFRQLTMMDPDRYGGLVNDVQHAKQMMNLGQGHYPKSSRDHREAGEDIVEGDGVTSTGVTGRFPIKMYLSCDSMELSPFQCLMRQQIEFFEAHQVDVDTPIQGRNRPIVLGQVGIRCVHCKHLSPVQASMEKQNQVTKKSRGAVYYPSTLLGVYQAAQVLCSLHLMGNSMVEEDGSSKKVGDEDDGASSTDSSCNGCPYVPLPIRQELFRLKIENSQQQQQSTTKKRNRTNTGKQYWARTASDLGVYEDTSREILRFRSKIGHFVCPKQQQKQQHHL